MNVDYISKRDRVISEELVLKPTVQGNGLLNSLIDTLPIPLHLPGYNYAGPGTPLDLHLEHGVKPVNKLDEAAMYHDIAYSNSHDLKDRHAADYVLQEEAWKRVKAPDASLEEKANAWLVTTAMRAKRAVGAGVRKTKYINYPANLDEDDMMKLKKALTKGTGVTLVFRCNRTKESISGDAQLPLSAKQIRRVKQFHSQNKNVRVCISATQLKNALTVEGGFLPALLAAVPAITAVGSLIAQGVKAYNDKKANDKLVEEKIRHNKAVEAITSKSKGSGVYLNKRPVSSKSADDEKSTTGNGLYRVLMKAKKSRSNQF